MYLCPSACAGGKYPGTGIPDGVGSARGDAMRGSNVYLEAPSRTQELLNIKWTLLAAGFRIASTWHEGQGSTWSLSPKDHWNAKGVEQLQTCDSLLVICGNDGKAVPEMALMAGLCACAWPASSLGRAST